MNAMPTLPAPFERRLHAAMPQSEAKSVPDSEAVEAFQKQHPTIRVRLLAWAGSAMESECRKVATAKPGTRNNALFAAACRLNELANTDLLDADEADSKLREAAEKCGLDSEETEAALASARGTVSERGIDVREVAFVKEAGAPTAAPAVAEAPECPPDPSSSTRVLAHSKNGRSLSALAGTTKKLLSPAAQDVFFGRATATKENAPLLLAELAAAARSVPGASADLVLGIVLVSEDEKATRVFADDRDLWTTVWAKWHAAVPIAGEEPHEDSEGPPDLLGAGEPTPRIVIHQDSYYVQTKPGRYDVVGVTAAGLLPRLQEAGIEQSEAFGVDYQDAKGNWKKRSASWLLSHVTTAHVDQVTYQVGAESKVEHLGTPRAALRHGVAPVNINLPPLTAEEIREQEEIDEAIVGPERVDLYRDTLAVSGREECVLQLVHLNGDAGTGKGFTIAGLRDLFGGSSGQDVLTTPFSESLLHHSLLTEEEGLNCDDRLIPLLVNRVRDLVTNDTHPITRKGRPTVLLTRRLRIFLSENGDRSLRMVLGSDNAASQKASMIRVLSFQTLPSAKQFFDAKGGRAGLSRPGAEHIGGDPHKGGMKRARYIAWLARERVLVNVDPGGRFAIRDPRETISSVDGTDVRLLQPRAMAVLEIIASTTIGPATGSAVLVEHEGQLYVSAAALTAKIRERRIACTAKQVANDLRLLAPTDAEDEDTRRVWADKRRLHRLDARRIVEASEEQQLDVSAPIHRLAQIRTTK